jgi:putative transposase
MSSASGCKHLTAQKFWARVCAELANRGIKDVLILCCDGLTGFPEAIEATWPHSTNQTCVVHLIRAAMRFVNWHDRKNVAAALKPVATETSPTSSGSLMDSASPRPMQLRRLGNPVRRAVR